MAYQRRVWSANTHHGSATTGHWVAALLTETTGVWKASKRSPKSNVGGRSAGISPVSSPLWGSCRRYRQRWPQFFVGSSSAKTITLSRGTTMSARRGWITSPAR